jgi:hypothetical protein
VGQPAHLDDGSGREIRRGPLSPSSDTVLDGVEILSAIWPVSRPRAFEGLIE